MSDEDIAHLFSVGRPLVSSKQFRRPTRGALGNGIRVVAGAVLASGGRLIVETGGRRILLKPRHDGTTEVVRSDPSAASDVVRVEVYLGGQLKDIEDNVFQWAGTAVMLARAKSATPSASRPSPHWHTRDSFSDLLRDAESGTTVRQVVEQFSGLSGTKAASVAGDETKGRTAADLSPAEMSAVYKRAKDESPVMTHNTALGRVGELATWGRPKMVDTTIERNGATIPVRIEVWARPSEKSGGAPEITVSVNRTPCTAAISLRTFKEERKHYYAVHGAGLGHKFAAKPKPKCDILVNVQCPAMPITSDGKSPDLDAIVDPLFDALENAVKAAQRKAVVAGGSSEVVTQKSVILMRLDEAVAKASGGGKYRYSLRQLFYVIRPFVIDACGEEPGYDWFSDVVRDYEINTLGKDLPGIYRDSRGVLYHPHLGIEIPLGTLSVERYKRPPFTFNKILYSEKEGLITTLKEIKWPERNDCALLTSKGFSTYAVRDLLDLLDASDEPITIFVIHDADGSGTLIYETLRKGLEARAGRPIQIINLGLEPAEAVEMKLTVEKIARDKAVPVASYVPGEWVNWLQGHRSELNAMTTPQFVEWLDLKFAPYRSKVVPPAGVVANRLRSDLEEIIRRREISRILREAGIDSLVNAKMDRMSRQLMTASSETVARLPSWLEATPEDPWWELVFWEAGRLADEACQP